MTQQGDQAFQSRFDCVAAGYDSPALRAFPAIAARLVEVAGVSPGQIVIDACCGTGHAAIAAARRVAPTGRVIAIDASPEMCARVREKTSSGLSGLEVRVADATALAEIADLSIDVVVSASAVYTLPDPGAALAEWRRVLRLGGVLAFSTLGSVFDPLYVDLLRRYGLTIPTTVAIEALSREDACEALALAAGFRQVTVVREQFGYFLPRIEDCWDIIWNTGARIPLTYLPPEVVARVKQDYLTAIVERLTSQGVWIDWPALLTRAS